MSTEPPPHRRRDVARLHEHILGHARVLLAESGPDRFRYAALSRRARVTRTTIIAHWPARPLLFRELFTDAGRDLLAGLPHEPLTPRAATRPVVREFLAGLWAGLQDPQIGAPLAVVFAVAETDPLARDAVSGLSRDLRDALNLRLAGTGAVVNAAEFDTLAGPLFAARFFGAPAGQDQVEFLVQSWWAARELRHQQPTP